MEIVVLMSGQDMDSLWLCSLSAYKIWPKYLKGEKNADKSDLFTLEVGLNKCT